MASAYLQPEDEAEMTKCEIAFSECLFMPEIMTLALCIITFKIAI